MASLFKRAALAFGRFTGRRTRPESTADVAAAEMPLIEPVAVIADVLPTEEPAAPVPSVEPIDELIEKSGQIPTLDESAGTPWDETLPKASEITNTTAAAPDAEPDQALAVTASLYETPASETTTVTEAVETPVEPPTTTVVATADPEVEAAGGAIVLATIPEAIEIPSAAVVDAPATVAEAPTVEAPAPVTAEAEKPAETPVASAPVVEPILFSVEPVKGPVELKPEPAPAPLTTLAELYELVATEVDRRTDGTVAVYERLLAATRHELDATRRNNRIAWSVGGVMSAVAVMGAVWSSGEFAATHTEIGALRQQVSAGQQVSAERDQLRAEVTRVKDSYAKVEVDALKARLDQALAVSADRDRLRTELDRVQKDRQEIESELRLARAGATTQPISDARQVGEKTTARTTVAATAGDKAAGAERPDVWSALLNGRD
jgi:hypothetical protein